MNDSERLRRCYASVLCIWPASLCVGVATATGLEPEVELVVELRLLFVHIVSK